MSTQGPKAIKTLHAYGRTYVLKCYVCDDLLRKLGFCKSGLVVVGPYNRYAPGYCIREYVHFPIPYGGRGLAMSSTDYMSVSQYLS